jgi:hypothetical protein
MKLLAIFTILSGLTFAETDQPKLGNAIEESRLDPTVEKAKMPGTRSSIEEVNTSPNPVPEAEEYDFNEVLIDGDYIQDRSSEEEKKLKQSQEDIIEE